MNTQGGENKQFLDAFQKYVRIMRSNTLMIMMKFFHQVSGNSRNSDVQSATSSEYSFSSYQLLHALDEMHKILSKCGK